MRSDSEQLKSLAVAGDRSQGELESRLNSQAAELRSSQMKVQQLQADLQQRFELYEEAKMQYGDAQSTMRQLDSERDKLQAELDHNAERLAELEEQHTQARGRIVVLEQSNASLEQRLVHADRHLQQLQQELHASADREDVAKRDLVALQQDYERLQVRTCAGYLPHKNNTSVVCHKGMRPIAFSALRKHLVSRLQTTAR